MPTPLGAMPESRMFGWHRNTTDAGIRKGPQGSGQGTWEGAGDDRHPGREVGRGAGLWRGPDADREQAAVRKLGRADVGGRRADRPFPVGRPGDQRRLSLAFECSRCRPDGASTSPRCATRRRRWSTTWPAGSAAASVPRPTAARRPPYCNLRRGRVMRLRRPEDVQSLLDHGDRSRDQRAVRVVNRYVGHLAPMPGVFPDYAAAKWWWAWKRFSRTGCGLTELQTGR